MLQCNAIGYILLDLFHLHPNFHYICNKFDHHFARRWEVLLQSRYTYPHFPSQSIFQTPYKHPNLIAFVLESTLKAKFPHLIYHYNILLRYTISTIHQTDRTCKFSSYTCKFHYVRRRHCKHPVRPWLPQAYHSCRQNHEQFLNLRHECNYSIQLQSFWDYQSKSCR